MVKTGAMTPPAGAGPEDIVVTTSDVCRVDAAPGRLPDGGSAIDLLVLRSSSGAGAWVLERHGTDPLTRPRFGTAGPPPAASVSLDER